MQRIRVTLLISTCLAIQQTGRLLNHLSVENTLAFELHEGFNKWIENGFTDCLVNTSLRRTTF